MTIRRMMIKDNEYQVTVVATDQTGHAANLPVTVTVTDVNEGPVIADTGANTVITVQENHDQVLATYAATDPEDPDRIITRWSVTGRDGGDFTVNEDGELSFRNLPDHERPADSNRDNTYEVTIRASDGRYYGTLDAVVTVEAVDEPPEFQRNAPDSFAYQENGISAIHTYRATDPEGSDLTWSLSGTDSSAFSISRTGVLTFNTSPDYEDPKDSGGNNVYLVTVETSDRKSNKARLDVTVTVTNLTDARAVIRGTAQVGRTLTAETSGISDEDGLARATFSYQWSADDMDVEGATYPTYKISKKDEGKTIKVRVTFTDNAGKEKTLTSAATAPVKPAQSNEPATGLPTIDGTAQVGETLTADTSDIADSDGLTNATFTYQWLADDADISGATGSTYTLADADSSKAIKVRVSFTDDAGNEETLTSAATEVVTGAEPAERPSMPTGLSGDAYHDRVILSWDDPGDASIDGYMILRRQHDTHAQGKFSTLVEDTGTSETTYTDDTVTPEKRYTYRIKAINEHGESERSSWFHTDTPAEPSTPATGAPTISGTAQVGETLTADTSGIADENGLTNATFAYQWLADDAEIAGATGSSYTLAEADEGKAIKARVSFTDDGGNAETLTSAATAAVVGAGPTEPPAKPRTLRATEVSHDKVTLTWRDPQDNTITGYMILRRDKDIHEEGTFETVEANTGTAETTYTDTSVYPEKRYVYRIKAINAYDESEISSWVRAYTPAAPATENTPATGEPTINGTARVGETLTAYTSSIADEEGLSDATFTYQWLADDAEIAGATGSSYTLAEADEGKAIKVRVSFTDDADNEETLTSTATAAVSARPNSPVTGAPTISGTAQVGETLTADISSIADEDGLNNATLVYQWLADGAEIAGATNSAYTLGDADRGKAIQVRVSFTDDAGNEESLTSAATAAVAAKPNSPATGVPTISGTAQVGETLTAETSGIADEDGLGNATFSYQWLADDTEIAGATNSAYTLGDADRGKAIQVRVSFTDDAGNEETLTSEPTEPVAGAVTARANSPATGAPTISGTAQVGETLTADSSSIGDADGLDNASFSYQWLADEEDISGANESTYTLSDADRSRAIKVRVSFTDDAGNEETLTSAATEVVTALIWSATLTAGSDATYSGYSLLENTGALSPGEFSLGAIEYSVKMATEDEEGMLSFGVDHALPTTFTLHVGTLRFASEDASLVDGDGAYTYRWDKRTVDWSVGEEVELRLTLSDTPLMAAFADTPESHDGQSAFTFELRFSEHFGLSYKTLRDHAFTVTGGEVTNARRLERGSNTRWEITVRPNSDGDVTIVLPVTEDCEAQGAICTGDGRQLSSRLEFTVSGPSG